MLKGGGLYCFCVFYCFCVSLSACTGGSGLRVRASSEESDTEGNYAMGIPGQYSAFLGAGWGPIYWVY